MDSNIRPLERAFQLAQSGQYPTVDAIKRQLLKEGYSALQIQGRAIHQQLAAIIKTTRSPNAPRT